MSLRITRWSAGAAAIVIVANAIALGGVAYNRSGTPTATLSLTERELRRIESRDNDENTGMSLELRWRMPNEPPSVYGTPRGVTRTATEATWLDRAKLESLGFDLSASVATDSGRASYRRQRPRMVYVVLELEGPAYTAMLARAARYDSIRLADTTITPEKRAPDTPLSELEWNEKGATRLFAVDAGRDRDALRARYADRSRYAIVRARVGIYPTDASAGWRVDGRIIDVLGDRMNVPKAMRGAVAGISGDYRSGRTGGGAAVTVAFGRRLEPWILSATASPR